MNIKWFYFFIIFILFGCFNEKNKNIDPSHIKLDNDIYLKPIGKNKSNCSLFSPYSITNKGVIQVIYYLDKNKKPTTESNPENCL